MSPDDIKTLRRELSCTARELAVALDLEPDIIVGWERGDLFPTKRYVGKMEDLRRKGPSAIPRKRKKPAASTPLQALADPALWLLVRKLLAHAELRTAAEALAVPYPDPVDDP